MSPTGLDACLDLVADRHRRRLLGQLRQAGDREAAVDDLVDSICRGEPVTGEERHPDREALAIQVYHTHLPKLAAFGLVDYTPGCGTVRYRPDERVEAVLDSLPEDAAVASP